MVYAPYNPCRCTSLELVSFSDLHRHIRMSACWFVLAASSATTLHRLAEVLLGKWDLESALGRHYSMLTRTDDMATTNVHQEQDLVDMRVRSGRLVSKFESAHAKADSIRNQYMCSKHSTNNLPLVHCFRQCFG